MTELMYSSKIRPEHLVRRAIVYFAAIEREAGSAEFGESASSVRGSLKDTYAGLESGGDHR